MRRPEDCKYTKDHEWVYLDGDVAIIGITDFAQQELGDIVYVNMGEAGRQIAERDEIGEIESVKAVAEVYAPISGEVLEVNPGLADHPETLNSDPLGEGWLLKVKPSNPAQLAKMLSLADYLQFLKDEGH
ncbi:MAG: glycine cleavage system protein GcvH [Acidobacteria bacterium]|nr:glycine cleavage system protein GcvH [Acidobacteriota bacterium]